MNETKLKRPPAARPAEAIVFCDFDGTISLADVTDTILARFADPSWQEIERLWRDGAIGSQECLARQLALVRATKEQLHSLIDEAPVDPGFAGFVRYVRKRRVPFAVTSDGLDIVIRRVLARSGFHAGPRNGIHFFSASARWRKGRLTVSFPHAAASCTHGCATCKPAILESQRGGHWPLIYVGDGLSDRHAVKHADFVFARQPLLGLCRESGIPCRPLETFADVTRALSAWLGEVADAGEARRQIMASAV